MAGGLSGATLLNVGILLGASFLVGELFERVGLESILGYILTGFLLGPSIFDVMAPGTVTGFATIGATLILFQAGLKEENIKDIFFHKEGLQLGLLVLLGTFTVIFGALYFYGASFLPYSTVNSFIFLALAYALVDIAVPTKLMLTRGMLREDKGTYTVKSSVINVSAGFLLLTLLVILATPSITEQVIKAGSIVGFALAFYVLHEAIHKVDDYIMMFEETEAQFAITFALLLFLSYITQTIGLSSILGAFFAGVLVSRGDFSDARSFQDKVKGIAEGLFIPIFFAWFGLGLKATVIWNNLEAAFLLFLLSTIVKFIIGYLIPYYHGMDDPYTIAASLLSLDVETLVVIIIGIDLGVLTDEMLQIFAPSVLFTTLTIVTLYSFIDEQ